MKSCQLSPCLIVPWGVPTDAARAHATPREPCHDPRSDWFVRAMWPDAGPEALGATVTHLQRQKLEKCHSEITINYPVCRSATQRELSITWKLGAPGQAKLQSLANDGCTATQSADQDALTEPLL